MLPKSEREKDLIIIDLGGRTTNVVEYKNKKLINKDTVNKGMIDLFGEIKVKYNNTDGADEPIETYEVYHYIKNNQIPLYEDIADKFIIDIIKRVKLTFNLGLGKTIYFTVGGSVTLKESIKKYDYKFKFMDNPLYTNVKGNMKIAKAKEWCK